MEDVPHDSRALYHVAPHLKEPGSLFAASLPKHLGPMGLLYVSQREFAACSPHDSKFIILLTQIRIHAENNHTNHYCVLL